MSKKIFVFLIALLSVTVSAPQGNVYAQDSEAEYFSKEILQAKKPAEKIAALIQMSNYYYSKGNYNECRMVCDEAIKLNPKRKDQIKIFKMIGDAFLAEQNYARAIEMLQEAIILAPDHIGTRLLLVEAYLKSDLYELAEQECLRILQYDKHSFQANYTLGELYFNKGFSDKAFNCYKAAISEKFYAPAFRKASECLEHMGDTRYAITMIKKAIAISPVYEDYIAAAHLFEEELLYKDSEEMLQAALASDPERIDSYIALGVLFLNQNKLKEARETFVNASRYFPESSIARFFLGYTAYKQDDLKTAKTEANKAYEFSKGKTIKHYSSVLKELLKS